MKLLGWICAVTFSWALGVSGWAEDAPASPPKTFDLTTVLQPDTLWNFDKKALVEALKDGPFQFTSKENTELRGADAPLVYQGLPVLEVIIRFKESKISEVFLSLYNRGDAGSTNGADFASLVSKTQKILDTQSGVQGVDLEDSQATNKFRNLTRIWMSPKVSFRLETAFSKVQEEGSEKVTERPEFVNLTILPGGLAQEDVVSHKQVDLVFVDFDKRVEHDSNGDVLIPNIPMVDQGQKGYCAVATMERILRYYGSEVNEHELAQQADSSGKGGTDPASLAKAMRAMANLVGLRFNEFFKYDPNEFFAFVEHYNRAATLKGMKDKVINLPTSGTIEVSDVYHEMSIDVLRDMKLKEPTKIDTFFGYVTSTIDKGWPLAWSVNLGWVEEKPSLNGAYGGHMRLIIGYNNDAREVLYSDSWGIGHELKRMSVEDAYIMSEGLYYIEPKL